MRVLERYRAGIQVSRFASMRDRHLISWSMQSNGRMVMLWRGGSAPQPGRRAGLSMCFWSALGAIRYWTDFKSLAHWLSWCCSMTPGVAREHVRVAKALRKMPTIAALFQEGRLSVHQVLAAAKGAPHGIPLARRS